MTTVRQRFGERVFALHGRACIYCGRADRYLTIDHFVPKKRGGKSQIGNLVPACGRCNSTKSDRTLDEVRPLLVLSMLGWPRFTPEQLDWMRANGFDMQAFDNAVLPIERKVQPWLQSGVNTEHAPEMPVNGSIHDSALFAPPQTAIATPSAAQRD